ncbi:MAG TPA: stage II sporulation protein D [Firmicutes bacterium]|nr:stage II sporulation protein D [Bacillota bacterium]
MRSLNALIRLLLIILLILAPLILLKRLAPPRQNYLSNIPITLLSTSEGRIYHTDLESYLIGVVAAEMPANFEIDALRAQAIAARTIAVQRLKRFGGRGSQQYPGVDFSDDPNENQAWQSVAELKTKWGEAGFPPCYAKIKKAVTDTSGIIMTYHKKPIDALFHSTCGVGTADASEIWHHQVPYLKSVDCGFDYQSPHYINQINLSWPEIARGLHISLDRLKIIRIRQRSKRGRVLWISVNQYLYSGEDFRKALTLNSTCFSCNISKNGVAFKTIGYGHGVGMCQYGANGMAKQGYTYLQILLHYYQGIQFSRIR